MTQQDRPTVHQFNPQPRKGAFLYTEMDMMDAWMAGGTNVSTFSQWLNRRFNSAVQVDRIQRVQRG